MFVEVNRFLLAPLLDRYRIIDNLPKPGTLQFIKNGLAGIFTSLPSLVLGSLKGLRGLFVLVWVWLNNQVLISLDDKEINNIRENYQYNFGALMSLRELVSGQNFSHYFQKLDQEKYFKVIEKQILESLNSFLEAHNIDTSDLKARQTTILNSGVIVQGQGKLVAEALAVGGGGQAKVETHYSHEANDENHE
ncbi:MAG: hypothetical protein H6658_11385 [Ardenticatenaceae bacterium]|nr:hypothetical protein [Ardenticatenaceae bacterium]